MPNQNTPVGKPAMMGKPMLPKGRNQFFGVMPIAIMALSIVVFLLLIFIAVTD